MKMVRTQIQLPEDMHRRLKAWANRIGISMSEAVRRCVAERLAGERLDLGREGLVREALAVVGKYSDPAGPSRVAKDHDEHLPEAYGG
ncbi:MAG: ribbon-helix-helix protein, CopG family [Gemmatimonadetes bacterium]|nr:ribbon-helix-helix protein, CopG family [Gemmatimonadota bacterium]NIO32131.1 ribbon-helix-helix protein, CopG family [Gemmatimonadota bacterium]